MTKTVRGSLLVLLLSVILGIPPLVHGQELVDLSSWDFETKPSLSLHGPWAFYWQKLLDPNTLTKETSTPIIGDVQARQWMDPSLGKLPPHGFGTYVIKIKLSSETPPLALLPGLIGSSAKMWWNGSLLTSYGSPGASPSQTVHQWRSAIEYLPMPKLEPGTPWVENELIIQVANFGDITSSFQNTPPILGTIGAITARHNQNLALYFGLAGISFAVGLYHLLSFLFRNQERSNLFFAGICWAVAMRLLFSDTMAFVSLFPSTPWSMSIAINYLSYALLVFFFAAFVSALFPYPFNDWFVAFSALGSLLYSLLLLITPPVLYTQLLVWFQIFSIVVGIGSIIIFVLALLDKKRSAILFGLGFLIMFGTAIHDIIIVLLRIESPSLATYGILSFILVQALVLARHSAHMTRTTERLSAHLQRINKAHARFIPTELSQRIGRDYVADLQPGDYTEDRMAVVALDYGMSYQASINADSLTATINSVHDAVGPIIREFGGYVIRYHAMGMSAVFPHSASHGLNCCLALVRSALQGKLKNGAPLRLLAGMHAGTVLAGIIGERDHMNGAIISSHLEDAQTLLRRGRALGSLVTLSKDALGFLESNESYHFRKIGGITLHKGQQLCYDFFDSDELEDWKQKRSTSNTLNRALNFMVIGQKEKAIELFRSVLAVYPTDQVAHYHLDKLDARLVD